MQNPKLFALLSGAGFTATWITFGLLFTAETTLTTMITALAGGIAFGIGLYLFRNMNQQNPQ